MLGDLLGGGSVLKGVVLLGVVLLLGVVGVVGGEVTGEVTGGSPVVGSGAGIVLRDICTVCCLLAPSSV